MNKTQQACCSNSTGMRCLLSNPWQLASAKPNVGLEEEYTTVVDQHAHIRCHIKLPIIAVCIKHIFLHYFNLHGVVFKMKYIVDLFSSVETKSLQYVFNMLERQLVFHLSTGFHFSSWRRLQTLEKKNAAQLSEQNAFPCLSRLKC